MICLSSEEFFWSRKPHPDTTSNVWHVCPSYRFTCTVQVKMQLSQIYVTKLKQATSPTILATRCYASCLLFYLSKALFSSRDIFLSVRDFEFAFFFLKYELKALSSSAVNEPNPPIKSKSVSVFLVLILLIFEIFVY